MQGLLYKYTLTRHKKGLENVVSGVADQLFQLLWEEPDTLLHYLETLGGNKEATSGFNDVMYQLYTNNVNLKFLMTLKFSSTELSFAWIVLTSLHMLYDVFLTGLLLTPCRKIRSI